MVAERALIVNADDFGQSHGVNRGVILTHERGIVTSASLMVRWPAAVEAAVYARSHPRLSVGLHFDLGEWAYRQDEWVPVYEVLASRTADLVEKELDRQLGRFQTLVGRNPTHLDSHQHAHREEPVRSILGEAAVRLGVPLRDASSTVRYRGDFYGQTGKGDPYPQAITVEALVALIEALPPGLTELGCHPGEANDDLDTMYRAERAQELAVLCDARVYTAVAEQSILLWSFVDLPAARS